MYLSLWTESTALASGMDIHDAFRHVELSFSFRENILLHEEGHKVASWQVFHNEIEVSNWMRKYFSSWKEHLSWTIQGLSAAARRSRSARTWHT